MSRDHPMVFTDSEIWEKKGKAVTYYPLYNFVILRRWIYNYCLLAMLEFVKYSSKTAFVGIWSHCELKAVGKKSRFHPVWLQQYTQVGWDVRNSQLRIRNTHLFPLQVQVIVEL